MFSFRGEETSRSNCADGFIGIIINCHYGRHSFCPREKKNLLSWTDVVQRRRLLSLCALRESRVVPHISWPRERNMRSRLKSETRCTGTNLVAHFSALIYRTRDGTTGKQISYQAAKAETLYSVKSEEPRKGILVYLKNSIWTIVINYTKI